MREPVPELEHERSVQDVDGLEVTVLAFGGDLDLAVADALAAALEEGAVGTAGAVVDFTDVRFIDSAGIHAVVRAQEDARAGGRRLELVVAPESSVDRVLAITGLSEHLAIHPSREAALAALAAAGGKDAV